MQAALPALLPVPWSVQHYNIQDRGTSPSAQQPNALWTSWGEQFRHRTKIHSAATKELLESSLNDKAVTRGRVKSTDYKTDLCENLLCPWKKKKIGFIWTAKKVQNITNTWGLIKQANQRGHTNLQRQTPKSEFLIRIQAAAPRT